MSAANFHLYFRQRISVLQEQTEYLAIPDLSIADRKTKTDTLLAEITKLSSELADASSGLPPYDQRSYNSALKDLQDKLAISQASHAPKAKFSFKNKRLAASLSRVNSATTSESVTPPHQRGVETGRASGFPIPTMASPPIRLSSDVSQTGAESSRSHLPVGVVSLEPSIEVTSNTYLRYPKLTEGGDEVSPNNEQNCVVSKIILSIANLTPDARLPLSPFLTINDVESSFILAPEIRGPAHITNVRNSIVVLSCNQFRMHDSHNVDVYLYCTSRPVIENCSNIKFTVFPGHMLELRRDINSNQASQKNNMFDQVDDFKWLRAEPSPNWRFMEKDEEVAEGVWLEILDAFQKADEATQERVTQLPESLQAILAKLGIVNRALDAGA